MVSRRYCALQLTHCTATETYDLVVTTYTWNVRNQLTGIGKTGFTASFTYDSFGRRTGRTVNGTLTNYVYDGLNPVQEKNIINGVRSYNHAFYFWYHPNPYSLSAESQCGLSVTVAFLWEAAK